MSIRIFIPLAFITTLLSSCSQSGDSCDDLEGVVTSTLIELTGLKSATVFQRTADSTELVAIDPTIGTDFSNLQIDLEFSWIAEQQRFRAPSTFLQSALTWIISPAMACTLSPFTENYEPAINSIEVFSEADFNDSFTAGTNLASVFAANGFTGESSTLLEASNSNNLLSSRSYSLTPSYSVDELVAIPALPRTHIFTVIVTLDNGQAFETRTTEVLLSGI